MVVFKRNTSSFACLLGLVLLVTSIGSSAQEDKIVVVTYKGNAVSSMEKRELVNLFMGKYIAFSDGTAAVPVDFEGSQELKKSFYKKLVGLSLARVNAYWSRIKFTGSARPPINIENINKLDEMVKRQNSAVGYIYMSQVTDSMKVIYKFD